MYPYAGSQANAKAISSESAKSSVARVSDPRIDSSSGSSKGPSMGLEATNRDRDPKGQFMSQATGTQAGSFDCFKQKNFGDGNG